MCALPPCLATRRLLAPSRAVCRAGQKREVHVHSFVCDKSVETWQLRILERKRRMAKTVLGATEDNTASREEINELLGEHAQ